MKCGRKIMNLRLDRDIAQQTLAAMAGISASSLSRIESGQYGARAVNIVRIAKALGVTVEYLFDEAAPYPPPANQVQARAPEPTP